MIECTEPARIGSDGVTFRLRQRDEGEEGDDLLTVGLDRRGATLRSLTLTDDQASLLAAHTVSPEPSWRAPVLDQEAVEFSVTFEFDLPEDKKHDRMAVHDYGEGALFLTLPDGEEFRFGLAPDLAQKLHRLTDDQ